MAHVRTSMAMGPEFFCWQLQYVFFFLTITVSADKLSITQNVTSLEEVWSLPLAWYGHGTTPFLMCAHACDCALA